MGLPGPCSVLLSPYVAFIRETVNGTTGSMQCPIVSLCGLHQGDCEWDYRIHVV